MMVFVWLLWREHLCDGSDLGELGRACRRGYAALLVRESRGLDDGEIAVNLSEQRGQLCIVVENSRQPRAIRAHRS